MKTVTREYDDNGNCIHTKDSAGYEKWDPQYKQVQFNEKASEIITNSDDENHNNRFKSIFKVIFSIGLVSGIIYFSHKFKNK